MPFAPGQSGNPGGSRARKIISETLRRAALEGIEELRKGADKIVAQASEGDLAAWGFIRDSLDGKPAQAVVVSGDDEAPPVSLRATVELIHARPLPATGDT